MALQKSSADITKLWELPEQLLYHIVSFVAAPTHRATVFCHQIAPLCKEAAQSMLVEERSVALWNIVLQEDYGAADKGKTVKRRASKRLRRSPVDRVRDAHKLLQDNTDMAYFYLSEMANASRIKERLTKPMLCSLLDEYGPYLRINRVLSSGGLYLVEVCRARHVKEAVILKCVQELVENRGALVDMSTSETPQTQLTSLCVAAARGMPTVVKYLLQRGASKDIRSTGRFRLHTNPKKSLCCKNVTPLEFCQAMWNAEKQVGATDESLQDLGKCIQLLEAQP